MMTEHQKGGGAMPADVLVVGSTGLIGRTFLETIRDDKFYTDVIALTRRKIESLHDADHISQHIVDFERLEDCKSELAAAATFCALGTTIKKAGTKDKFRYVDYQLPLNIARMALENNCRKFILISAVGADADSRIFYNRIKGELENEIQKLPFKSIHILRPSLLMGEREEFRSGEVLGKFILQPIRHLLPAKYRPIHAVEIAAKVRALLDSEKPGVYIYQGLSLRQS
jgi:uncharacterized protein YbjT (DUF2867 family)